MNKKILGVKIGTILVFILSIAAAFITWLLVNIVV